LDVLLGEGLSTVIDMRSGNEIETAPNPFAAHGRVSYHNIGLFDHLAPKTMHDGEAQISSDPLLDFYVRTLASRRMAILDVLNAIAAASDGTVMFHCTAGKDRTGLISALLLGLVEVEYDDIISDYARTKPLIVDLVVEFLQRAEQNGTDLEKYRTMLDCKPGTMRSVIDHIADSYTSVHGYLDAIGLETTTRDRLIRRLMA